jgi:hypothetical protein
MGSWRVCLCVQLLLISSATQPAMEVGHPKLSLCRIRSCPGLPCPQFRWLVNRERQVLMNADDADGRPNARYPSTASTHVGMRPTGRTVQIRAGIYKHLQALPSRLTLFINKLGHHPTTSELSLFPRCITGNLSRLISFYSHDADRARYPAVTWT